MQKLKRIGVGIIGMLEVLAQHRRTALHLRTQPFGKADPFGINHLMFSNARQNTTKDIYQWAVQI